jgi:hypothetical protein
MSGIRIGRLANRTGSRQLPLRKGPLRNDTAQKSAQPRRTCAIYQRGALYIQYATIATWSGRRSIGTMTTSFTSGGMKLDKDRKIFRRKEGETNEEKTPFR